MAVVLKPVDDDDLKRLAEGNLTADEQKELEDELGEVAELFDLNGSPAAIDQDKILDELQKEWLSLTNPAIWTELG